MRDSGERAARWLAPDLALVAAAVTCFYCLFLYQGYQNLFRDSDAGWHIRNGEIILASGELPHTDPFSFSRPGERWFAWEWGADVIVGAVHRAGGLSAVAGLYAVLIAAGLWLWFRLHWAAQGNFLIACAMAPLLLTTCSLHWMARPHVMSWLFLLATVWYAETGRRSLVWVAALSALWANLHGSFFLGPVILLIYGRPFAAAVAGAAALANPYGWNLFRHVFRYLTDSELLARIGEFQSFDFHTPGSWQIIATLILGIAGGTLALTRKRFDRFALSLLISAMALRSARALPLVALLLLPLANAELSRLLPRSFREYGDRLRFLDSRLGGYVWAPVVILAASALLRFTPVGFPPDQFPVAAYSHIPAEARLFASDKYGGYLIYRSNGQRKVFFDGRSDFYGAEFLKQYGRLVQVRPGWREYWDSWRFTHALLPNDAPLVPALGSAGWRVLYRDNAVTLLAGIGSP